MSRHAAAASLDFAYLDRIRDAAEAAIAEQLPVCFALWDSVESGIPAGALAFQLGISADRVRLLAEIAEHAIDERERRAMGP